MIPVARPSPDGDGPPSRGRPLRALLFASRRPGRFDRGSQDLAIARLPEERHRPGLSLTLDRLPARPVQPVVEVALLEAQQELVDLDTVAVTATIRRSRVTTSSRGRPFGLYFLPLACRAAGRRHRCSA